MKVVALVHNYIPDCRGGAEMMLHEILKRFHKEGHEVEVLVPNSRVPGKKSVIDGVTITYGINAKQKVSSISADLLISHLLEAPRAAAIARSIKAKFIHIIHNDNASTKVAMADGADLFVFNTKWLQAELRRPGIVVHPPVFASAHSTTPGDRITLVNMIPAKGSHVFYALADHFPDLTFLAVEGGYGKQDFRSAPNILHQANTANMRDDVWAKTGILIMPSDYESYGLVGVEAMCSGIPVIAHPTPGLKESLGDAGIFANRGNILEWIDAIKRIKGDKNAYANAALKRAKELDTDKELGTLMAMVNSL